MKYKFIEVKTLARLSREEKQYLQYQIYSLRYDDPWIPNKKIAKIVGRPITTVNRLAKEAEENVIVYHPQCRLYCPNERGALLLIEDKYKAFNELKENPHMTYECLVQGGWDILVLYYEPMNLAEIRGYKGMLLEGPVRNVILPKVPYISWEKCFQKMEDLLDKRRHIEESTLDREVCYPDWDEEEWRLYYTFKDNLRKNFNKFRKQCRISWRKYGEWKKNLRKYCKIDISYYPDGYEAYISMLLSIRTHHEKYIWELFSFLPASPVIFKIGDNLLIAVLAPRNNWHQYRILGMISLLRDDGIINSYLDGFPLHYEKKEKNFDEKIMIDAHQFRKK